MGIQPLHRDIARIVLTAVAGRRAALGGGNALLVHEVTSRHGPVLSSAQAIPDKSGRTWQRDPSCLLRHFTGVADCRDGRGLDAWLRSADWAAISV